MLIKSLSEGPSKILGEAAGNKNVEFTIWEGASRDKGQMILNQSILKITKPKTNKTENKIQMPLEFPQQAIKQNWTKCLDQNAFNANNLDTLNQKL